MVTKNQLIRWLTQEYNFDEELMKMFASHSDEEIAEWTGWKVLRKGYFVWV